MKLQDLLEYTDMVNMDADDRSHEIKNPLPNILTPEDPFFGDAYDALDEAEYLFVHRELGKENFEKLDRQKRINHLHGARDKMGKVKNIPISSLLSTESTVDPEHIENLKTGKTKSKGVPVVVKFKNKNVVIDGNHRVVATYMQGKKDVSVLYIDLDVQLNHLA